MSRYNPDPLCWVCDELPEPERAARAAAHAARATEQEMMNVEPELWNIRKAADYLGMTSQEFRALIDNGKVDIKVRKRGFGSKVEAEQVKGIKEEIDGKLAGATMSEAPADTPFDDFASLDGAAGVTKPRSTITKPEDFTGPDEIVKLDPEVDALKDERMEELTEQAERRRGEAERLIGRRVRVAKIGAGIDVGVILELAEVTGIDPVSAGFKAKPEDIELSGDGYFFVDMSWIRDGIVELIERDEPCLAGCALDQPHTTCRNLGGAALHYVKGAGGAGKVVADLVDIVRDDVAAPVQDDGKPCCGLADDCSDCPLPEEDADLPRVLSVMQVVDTGYVIDADEHERASGVATRTLMLGEPMPKGAFIEDQDPEAAEDLSLHAMGIADCAPGDLDLLEAAWGIIANANEGNWDTARADWREAAERWRGNWHARLEVRDQGKPCEDPVEVNVGWGEPTRLIASEVLPRQLRDPELDAMQAVVDTFEALDKDARLRVVAWSINRYGLADRIGFIN